MSSKHILKAHLIFSVKYRKKLLQEKFNQNRKAILVEISENFDFTIEVIQTEKDHVHMMIDYIPKLSMGKYCEQTQSGFDSL